MISDISDEELHRKVDEIEGMVDDSGRPRLDRNVPRVHEARIERIVEKAMYESVVKHTAGFLFNSVGTALVGLSGAVMGHANVGMEDGETDPETDPEPDRVTRPSPPTQDERRDRPRRPPPRPRS